MAFIRFSKSFHSPQQPRMTPSDLRKGPGWAVKGEGKQTKDQGYRGLIRTQEEVLSVGW